MDQLHLICCFSKSKLPTSARVAASIDGLLLQGAMMVDGELTECSPDCSIFSPMPICYLAFVAHEEAKMFVGTGRVGVPLYVSNERTGMLAELHLPCRQGEQDKWVLSGTALFVHPDE